MDELGKKANDIACAICAEFRDPKLYIGLAVLILGTWDQLPTYVKADEWAQYVRSVLFFFTASMGITLRRPSDPGKADKQ